MKRKPDKSQETKEAQEARSGDEAKGPVVLTEGPGVTAPRRREHSDDDSDVRSRDRGRRNRSPISSSRGAAHAKEAVRDNSRGKVR